MSAQSGSNNSTAQLLGLKPQLVVQEIGWDDDVDDDIRADIEDAIDADMIEDAVEAVDCVVLWFRNDDGDLTDALMDSLTDLADDGRVWLFTPKVNQPGHVDPADIADGAQAAGLALTKTSALASDWSANQLVRPKSEQKAARK